METGSLEAVEVVAQHGVARQMGMVVANGDHLRELPMGSNGNFIGDKSAGHERHWNTGAQWSDMIRQ